MVGGRVTLALAPGALAALAADHTVALVSGTNGKTTTTAMLAAALQSTGPVATNLAGSNMFGGMVAALSNAVSGATAVLETDEAHLPEALARTRARLVLLLNLTRDQLDRVSEVRMQAQKWREALSEAGHLLVVVANADDPMVVWAAQGSPTVVWVAGGTTWRLDSSSCPACASSIHWPDSAANPASSAWACSGCDLRRPDDHAGLGLHASGSQIRVAVPDLQIPGAVNRRNAALAVTAAVLLGADPAKAVDAVGGLEAPGGRFETTEVNGMPVRLLLAKNPAGWGEAMRIVSPDGPLVIAINAKVQDGRDPSWLWDVDFEQLAGRFVVATGERGRDLAVRLLYARVEHAMVPDLAGAVTTASAHPTVSGPVDVLGNYSAFQQYRRVAAR